jgi:putative acetyltransferase
VTHYTIAPLGGGDAAAVAALAAQPSVARFGDHPRDAPPAHWARWLGSPDPNLAIVLGARDDGALCAVARLELTFNRRRMHRATLELVASEESKADPAIDALLGALLDAADRWLALVRCELRCPAQHPRIDGVLARHGFAREAVLRRSLRTPEGALSDEAILGRIRDGVVAPTAIASGERTVERGAPVSVRIRDVRPSDAAELALTMGESSVVWGTLQLPFQRPERWTERLAQNDPDRIVFLAAETRGRIAGAGALHFQRGPRRQHVARLGMHVARAYQGRGVGRRILDALLEEADGRDLLRIELAVYPDNDRARRLYDGAGFVSEGVCRYGSFRDGTLVDDMLMARVAG